MSSWWLVLLCGAVAAACSSKPTCDLAAHLRERAGSGATDCGHAVLGGDTTPVDSCVADAFNGGKAFIARYDRHGIDSKVVFGVAGDGKGNVTFLLRDSDPSGGSGADPVISGNQCNGPSLDTSANRDPFLTPPLSCTSTTSLGRTCG